MWKIKVITNQKIIGTLRSNDADSNEDVKKTKQNNRFYKQNNNFSYASHFLEHFFPVFALLRRENFQFRVVGRS